jgi:peptidoglycan/xylan/chitin deacetylase (PgdA/CDA1 family)
VLDRRRRMTRRPPRGYRWAGLLAAVGLVAAVGAVAMVHPGAGTTPAVGRIVRLAEDVPSAPAPVRPRVDPGLLSATRGGGKVVSLTFDDGPTARYTPQVLAVLSRNHVTATFCEIGGQARLAPALVRRVVAGGNRLCDHTITHDMAIGTRAPRVMDQQLRASRDVLVAASGGADVDYFRAPGGKWTPTLLRLSAQDGMQSLGWTIDTRDWTRPGTAAIVSAVERNVRPGAIVLFHDGGGPRDQTVAAIGQLIPWLRSQGYSIVFPT